MILNIKSPVLEEIIEKQLVGEFFDRKRNGLFVEVGANDPHSGSQTWLLEQNGWCGILVEPQAALCEKLRRERKNSQVFQVACSGPEREGEARCTSPPRPAFQPWKRRPIPTECNLSAPNLSK